MFVDSDFVLPSNSSPDGIVIPPFAMQVAAARLRGMLSGKVDINMRGLGNAAAGNDSPSPCGPGRIVNNRTGECVSACAPGWTWSSFTQRCTKPGMGDYPVLDQNTNLSPDAFTGMDYNTNLTPDANDAAAVANAVGPGTQADDKRVPRGAPQTQSLSDFFSQPLISGVPISRGVAAAVAVFLVTVAQVRGRKGR